MTLFWHPCTLKMTMRLGKSQEQVACFLFIDYSYLNNTVELIFKNIISFFDILKFESVRYERSGINLTFSNKRKHLVAFTTVNTARF